MKAKIVNEVQNFERGLDPKKAMDVGMYWKKDIKDLIEGLKKIGIYAKVEQSHNYAEGVFDFELENLFDEDDEEKIATSYQLSYVTKKAAEIEGAEDGWEPGFAVVSNEDGELALASTNNVNQVIKFFAKNLFGISLKARIIAKQKELDKLRDIQIYLDSITLPHLR